MGLDVTVTYSFDSSSLPITLIALLLDLHGTILKSLTFFVKAIKCYADIIEDCKLLSTYFLANNRSTQKTINSILWDIHTQEYFPGKYISGYTRKW